MAMLIAKQLAPYHPHARYPSVRPFGLSSFRFAAFYSSPPTNVNGKRGTRRFVYSLRATFGMGTYTLVVYLRTDGWRGQTWSSGSACKRTSLLQLLRSTCRPPVRLVGFAGSGKYSHTLHWNALGRWSVMIRADADDHVSPFTPAVRRTCEQDNMANLNLFSAPYGSEGGEISRSIKIAVDRRIS